MSTAEIRRNYHHYMRTLVAYAERYVYGENVACKARDSIKSRNTTVVKLH
jgi:hypothetical protein